MNGYSSGKGKGKDKGVEGEGGFVTWYGKIVRSQIPSKRSQTSNIIAPIITHLWFIPEAHWSLIQCSETSSSICSHQGFNPTLKPSHNTEPLCHLPLSSNMSPPRHPNPYIITSVINYVTPPNLLVCSIVPMMCFPLVVYLYSILLFFPSSDCVFSLELQGLPHVYKPPDFHRFFPVWILT